MSERRRTRTRKVENEQKEIKPKRTRGTRSREVIVLPAEEKKKEEPTALEIHDYDSTLRLQNYPEFSTILGAKDLKNLIGACYGSTREKLERMIEDPRTTIGELQAIVLSTDAMDSESTSRLKSKEYVDTRLFGKPAEKLELTGSGGSPIKIEASKKANLDELSDEDFNKVGEAMKILMQKEAEAAEALEESEDNK